MSLRVARVALVVLAVGLALHNVAVALLWDVGVRGIVTDDPGLMRRTRDATA